MSSAVQSYSVVKPIVHRSRAYKPGEQVSLSAREAQFLELAGKITQNKPQNKKGQKNVEDSA